MKIRERIAKLIDLKSIITLLIVGALIYGFVIKVINAEQFMMVATMILTFYFGKKDKNEDKKPTDEEVG